MKPHSRASRGTVASAATSAVILLQTELCVNRPARRMRSHDRPKPSSASLALGDAPVLERKGDRQARLEGNRRNIFMG